MTTFNWLPTQFGITCFESLIEELCRLNRFVVIYGGIMVNILIELGRPAQYEWHRFLDKEFEECMFKIFFLALTMDVMGLLLQFTTLPSDGI